MLQILKLGKLIFGRLVIISVFIQSLLWSYAEATDQFVRNTYLPTADIIVATGLFANKLSYVSFTAATLGGKNVNTIPSNVVAFCPFHTTAFGGLYVLVGGSLDKDQTYYPCVTVKLFIMSGQVYIHQYSVEKAAPNPKCKDVSPMIVKPGVSDTDAAPGVRSITLTLTIPPTAAPTTSWPSVVPTTLPTTDGSPSPSETPTQIPSDTPSEVPSVAPSVTPSVTPSTTPSARPSVQPSVIPSVSPSAMPSQIPTPDPSVQPSEVPSAVPSVTPTAEPSACPSTLPSVTPSAKPSRTPSHMPSVRPSRQPSARPSLKPTPKPTVVFSGIEICANMTIDDVHIETAGQRRSLLAMSPGSIKLMEVSVKAIATAIAKVLGLPEDAVSIESEHIVSSEDNVATVLVELKMLASAQGFSSYEACFVHFRTALETAVDTIALLDELVETAENINAYELYQITAVNFTSVTNLATINTEMSNKDGDDLTTGYFAGVVIGVIVAFLVLFALVYLCVIRVVGKDATFPASLEKGNAV